MYGKLSLKKKTMGAIANGGSVIIENPDFYTWINMVENRITEVRISCLFKDLNSGKVGRVTVVAEKIILHQSEEYNWAFIGFIKTGKANIPISISYSERKKEGLYSISFKKGRSSNFEEMKKNADDFLGGDIFKDWPFGK